MAFSDRRYLQVTETIESETADKCGLLYTLFIYLEKFCADQKQYMVMGKTVQAIQVFLAEDGLNKLRTSVLEGSWS